EPGGALAARLGKTRRRGARTRRPGTATVGAAGGAVRCAGTGELRGRGATAASGAAAGAVANGRAASGHAARSADRRTARGPHFDAGIASNRLIAAPRRPLGLWPSSSTR